MRKRFNNVVISILLLFGIVGSIGGQTVFAKEVERIHFGFRWYNSGDQSWNQQKWTKSGYYLKSNTVGIP